MNTTVLREVRAIEPLCGSDLVQSCLEALKRFRPVGDGELYLLFNGRVLTVHRTQTVEKMVLAYWDYDKEKADACMKRYQEKD
jgi:hypothetical protein